MTQAVAAPSAVDAADPSGVSPVFDGLCAVPSCAWSLAHSRRRPADCSRLRSLHRSRLRHRNPARRAPLRLRRSWAPQTRAMQDDDTANPGMLWVLDGEALWSRRDGASEQVLRRLPWRRPHQHEGRGGALSGLQRGARPPDRSRAAHQSLPHRAIRRRRRCRSRARSCWRSPPISRLQSRGMPIEIADDAADAALHRPPAARCSTAGRASSTCPAPNATTTTGARSSPARRCRRAIRTAIRSTAWNGRAWARCSGGCATA